MNTQVCTILTNQKTVLSASENHKETLSKVNIKKDLEYYMYVIIDPLATSRTTSVDKWEETLCYNYQTVFKIIIVLTPSGELQRNR